MYAYDRPCVGLMMMTMAMVVVLGCCWMPSVLAYGESSGGLPTYHERTVGSLINVARVGPSAYATAYMLPAGYPASGVITESPQVPIYFDPLLAQTAHSHSTDLATNCHSVQFNSCDGTAWYTRVRNTYTCNGLVGTGLQYSYSNNPLSAVNDGMCGWNVDSTGNYVCCPASGTTSSGSSCGGLRNMYLSSSYSRFGVGYAFDSQKNLYYWTLDLGACNTQTYANPIASGSHIIQSNDVRFFATYYDANGAPQSAQVFVGGQAYGLQLDVGTAKQGNYFTTLSVGSSCRSYYFQFTSASGAVYRYPESGYFNTFGEGSCDQDWTSTPLGSVTPAVPGAPINVEVSDITTQSATISWSAPATDGGSPVTSYTVYARAYGTEYTFPDRTGLSMTFNGFNPGTTVSVVIVAVNAVGSSPNSTAFTFITNVDYPSPSPQPSPAGVSPSPSPASAPPACSSASCLPASFDFHSQSGCISGILDQGQCGSCYSFCVASAAADRVCFAQATTPVLSPQEILDCGKDFVWFGATGCDGGDPYRAAQLVRDNGLPTAATTALSSGCRPYTCYNGNCASSPTCKTTCDNGSAAQKYKASSAYRVSGVDNTRLEIYNNGPVTAIFDVCQSFYDFYNDYSNRGKVWPGSCSSSSSDYAGGHAISIIGWGTDADGVDYWLMQNSWSTMWGDNGLFRMKRGVNQAGIENYVSAAGFTRTAKRFGGVSALEERSEGSAGESIPVSGDNELVKRSTQFALDYWYFTNNKDSFTGVLSLPNSTKRQAQQPVGSLSTGSPYSVSSVNSASLQVTSGQSVAVDFVASNGAESVNLVSTVSYGAASGSAASAAGVSVASSSSAVLSTGAIIGIAIGGAAAIVLLAGLTAAVVVGGVAIYKRRQANADFDYADHQMEMEAQGGGSSAPPPPPPSEMKAKRSTWFERRLLFQSITGRSPPVKVDA